MNQNWLTHAISGMGIFKTKKLVNPRCSGYLGLFAMFRSALQLWLCVTFSFQIHVRLFGYQLQLNYMQCLTIDHSFASGKSFIDFATIFLQISREQLSHDHLNLTPHFCPIQICCLKLLFLSGRTTLITCVLDRQSQFNTNRVAPIEAFNMITLCNPIPICYFEHNHDRNSLVQSILF